MSRLFLFILICFTSITAFTQKKAIKPTPSDPIHDSYHEASYILQNLKQVGKKVNIAKIPEGTYALEVYKVGYRSNDAYSTYLSMGKPLQLNKVQVEEIKKQNDGVPVSSEIVTVKARNSFSKELDIRENDVFFLSLIKL